MDNYKNKENYFLILKKLGESFPVEYGASEGARMMVAGYIDNNDILVDDISCLVDEQGSLMVRYKNTEILFQCQTNGLTQISIKEQTEKSNIWTVIDLPPRNMNTGEYEKYLPTMKSFCLDEEGIYETSYTPIKMKNGEQVFDQSAMLKTSFYGNDKLERLNIEKSFDNIGIKCDTLFQDGPSDFYDSEFPRALIFDSTGNQVLGFNMVAAAVAAKDSFKNKIQERRNIR